MITPNSAQFDLPQIDETAMKARKAGIICHVCQEAGHKSYQCPKNPELMGDGFQQNISTISRDEDGSTSGPPEPSTPPIERVERNPGFSRPFDHSLPPPGHHPSSHHHHPPGEGGHGRGRGRGGDNFNTYQPYQFHPRPPYFGGRGHHHRNDRNEGRDGEQQPRRALEDVVCYKVRNKSSYPVHYVKINLLTFSF